MAEGIPPPYLSIVVAARNDDYGGDFIGRFSTFLKVLGHYVAKYRLEAELVVVEWNPPADRPPLSEAIDWRIAGAHLSVRIVTVPPELHAHLENSHRVPMFEYLAKNVGVRHSRGDYVLATNPDLVFSPALVAFLARQKLSAENYYRIDRYDFTPEVPANISPWRAVEFAKRHIYCVNMRHVDRCGTILVPITRLNSWYYAMSGRWPGSFPFPEDRMVKDEPVFVCTSPQGVYRGLHTNAAGDFILAARNAWLKIRGFPEFTDTFTHLDGYAVHQFKAIGLDQCVLCPPCMILHADHDRSEQRARPQRPFSEVESQFEALWHGRLDPAINSPDWGFAAETLPEHTAC